MWAILPRFGQEFSLPTSFVLAFFWLIVLETFLELVTGVFGLVKPLAWELADRFSRTGEPGKQDEPREQDEMAWDEKPFTASMGDSVAEIVAVPVGRFIPRKARPAMTVEEARKAGAAWYPTEDYPLLPPTDMLPEDPFVRDLDSLKSAIEAIEEDGWRKTSMPERWGGIGGAVLTIAMGARRIVWNAIDWEQRTIDYVRIIETMAYCKRWADQETYDEDGPGNPSWAFLLQRTMDVARERGITGFSVGELSHTRFVPALRFLVEMNPPEDRLLRPLLEPDWNRAIEQAVFFMERRPEAFSRRYLRSLLRQVGVTISIWDGAETRPFELFLNRVAAGEELELPAGGLEPEKFARYQYWLGRSLRCAGRDEEARAAFLVSARCPEKFPPLESAAALVEAGIGIGPLPAS